MIHVGAAITDPKVKKILTEQLNKNGILVLPFGSAYLQHFEVIKKDFQGKISEEKICPVQYIPLTSKQDQLWM